MHARMEKRRKVTLEEHTEIHKESLKPWRLKGQDRAGKCICCTES